jgi:glycosyltransferase involved in cell wall biosynthesis
MQKFQIFLSLVLVVRNQSSQLNELLEKITKILQKNGGGADHDLVKDYELIVVDNGSEDKSVEVLNKLTRIDGFPNLQVFALTKEVDIDTAFWVGCENSLGDYVAIINPLIDDVSFLPKMLEQSVIGSDVVFAKNLIGPKYPFFYGIAFLVFQITYKLFNRFDLAKEAPGFRILSRRVINFILQHPQPFITYRYMPLTAGFKCTNLEYRSEIKSQSVKRFGNSIQRGIRLIVSTTQVPMRIVSSLALFGAAANLIYSIYIILVGIFKYDIAPGWLSLSLQQSGMFFLISLVLVVLAEYILHMVNLSNEGPKYYIAQEFTSAVMTRKQKLNLEETGSKTTTDSNSGQ